MNVTRSAEFTDSDNSNVSSIAPGIYTGYGWIFESNSLMKFRNQPNWFHTNRSSVAWEKIETVTMCQRAVRADRMSRVTIRLLTYLVKLLERSGRETRLRPRGE
jgi:hypothetical protein